METFKKVLNVFGIILAVIFSIALIGSLVVAPTLFGTNRFMQSENLKTILNSVDYETLLTEGEGNFASEEDAFVYELLEDEEFIALYVDDLFAQLDGSNQPKKLTKAAVMQVMENHMDALVEMAKAEMDADMLQYVTDEEIKDMLREALEEEAAGIADSFPSLSEMGIDQEALQVVGRFRDGLVTMVGLALVAVFAVIVWICQFPRFKSFMWLGVDFVFGAVATFLSALAVDAVLGIAFAAIPFKEGMAESVLEVLTGTMKKGALIQFVCAVVFIVIFIVGRNVVKKKSDTQTYKMS